MIITIVPIVMIVGGALIYSFATNPKLAEVGKWIMVAGLFAFAFANAGRTVNL